MLAELMAKYRVYNIRQLRKVATAEEVKEIDKYLLNKIRGK
jgi:hypothetical protein